MLQLKSDGFCFHGDVERAARYRELRTHVKAWSGGPEQEEEVVVSLLTDMASAPEADFFIFFPF